MIDYENLKLAHELALKSKIWLRVGIQFFDGKINYVLDEGHVNDADTAYSIDDLIIRLKEITKPGPKYKAGEELHHINAGFPVSFKATVSRWDESVSQYVYGYHGDWSLKESDIFPTRQALIEHQINYWRAMLEPDIQENQPQVNVDRCHATYVVEKYGANAATGCQHISDLNNVYMFGLKCLKCGEFFR